MLWEIMAPGERAPGHWEVEGLDSDKLLLCSSEGESCRHSSASAAACWHLPADADPEELDQCLALTTLSNSPAARRVQPPQ